MKSIAKNRKNSSTTITEPKVGAKELVEQILSWDSPSEGGHYLGIQIENGKQKHSWSCPSEGYKSIMRPVVHTSFTNPASYLKSCYGEVALKESFFEARKIGLENGSTISRFWKSVSSNPYDKAMYDWIKLIVNKNLPIVWVEVEDIPAFSRHTSVLSAKKVKEVILELTKLVEKEISKELAGKKGAIMHDGWTENGMHYIGVFAVYMKRVSVHGNALWKNVEQVQTNFLGVSAMANQTDENSEGTEFNAENHVQFFRDIFQEFYNTELGELATCQIAHNCNTNQRVAHLLNIPRVGCKNHKLNLEMKAWVNSDDDLSAVNESIEDTVLQAKRKIKSAAALRNLTDLKPVKPNKTRWSGLFYMFQRLLRICWKCDCLELLSQYTLSFVISL